jgi:hypothetical protein
MDHFIPQTKHTHRETTVSYSLSNVTIILFDFVNISPEAVVFKILEIGINIPIPRAAKSFIFFS